VRILLFTGKGGVGKTTVAAATAVRLADRGVKTLLVSTDAAHSLADAIGRPLAGEPVAVAPGLEALHLDTQRRFEVAWQDLSGYLKQLLSQGGVDPITAEELTVLPGIDEVLALLAVGELAEHGRWDALVVDCAPTAETLRLLALPEAFGWYLQRVFPVHRRLARGMRPVSALLGRPGTLPSEAVFDAVVRLAEDLDRVRLLLTDRAITSVRLVLTPEAVVTAETRRTFTALSLYGYQVDGIVANRIFPDDPAGCSGWQRGWVAAQAEQLVAIGESFVGLPVQRLRYRAGEPVGLEPLRAVAAELYEPLPGADPASQREAGPLLEVAARGGEEFELRLSLPLADRSEVIAARRGDELVVTVAGHRRILALPGGLRRCEVTGGAVSGGVLRLTFRPDPELWPVQHD
jgi:arsenite-transporting ATPase